MIWPHCGREFWPRVLASGGLRAGIAEAGGAGRRWFRRRVRRVAGRSFAGRPGCSTAGCGRGRVAGVGAAGRTGRIGGVAYRHAPSVVLARSAGTAGGLAGGEPVGVGAGLQDVRVEGDAVDNRGDEAGIGNTVPHSLNGRLVPIAMEARSSRSVMIWNSSSAPRESSWT